MFIVVEGGEVALRPAGFRNMASRGIVAGIAGDLQGWVGVPTAV